MQKQLASYYKRQMYRGRGAAARALDFFTLRAVFFAAGYLWFLSSVSNTLLALILAAVALAIFCVVMAMANKIRLEHFTDKERKRLAMELERDSLVLMPREELLRLARAHALTREGVIERGAALTLNGERLMLYALQQTEQIRPEALLRAYHSARRAGCAHAYVYCTSAISPEASAFARRLTEIRLTLFPPDALIGGQPDAEQLERAEQEVLERMSRRKQDAKERMRGTLSGGRAPKYLAAAAMLFIASFFTGYALYYRMMGGACLSFALASFFVARRE